MVYIGLRFCRGFPAHGANALLDQENALIPTGRTYGH